MKNGELIDRVQSLYSKGVASDDTRLSDRMIYHKLVNLRNRLMIEKRKNKVFLSPFNYSVLSCIEIIEAPEEECPCLPSLGCKFYRSKHKIPTILSDYNGHIILSVTDLAGNNFSETSYRNKKYSSGSKYTKSRPDFYIHNGFLYITTNKAPKVVSMEALFENPEDVENFKNYCKDTNEECQDCCTSMYDREFNVESSVVETIIEMCLQEFLQIFNSQVEDRDNNAQDSSVAQRGPNE